jgi:hypothetical protein
MLLKRMELAEIMNYELGIPRVTHSKSSDE